MIARLKDLLSAWVSGERTFRRRAVGLAFAIALSAAHLLAAPPSHFGSGPTGFAPSSRAYGYAPREGAYGYSTRNGSFFRGWTNGGETRLSRLQPAPAAWQHQNSRPANRPGPASQGGAGWNSSGGRAPGQGASAPQGREPYRPTPQNRAPYRGAQPPSHLGAWLQNHSNLSPEQQQRALENEPGFNRLPPQTQRQLSERLQQISRMPPAERQRTVDRIEAMERLTPAMRDQVRASAEEMRFLPPNRQRLLKKAFRDLRDAPPGQRAQIMASGPFQAQFTPQERSILSNLLMVEPYEPRTGFPPGYEPPPGPPPMGPLPPGSRP